MPAETTKLLSDEELASLIEDAIKPEVEQLSEKVARVVAQAVSRAEAESFREPKDSYIDEEFMD